MESKQVENNKDFKAAKRIFDDYCKALDDNGWKYDKDESDLTISYSVRGDDLPMQFIIIIDSERQLVRVLSKLPVTAPPERITDIAIAVSQTNYMLADGSFDLNVLNGSIYFRMVASYRDCVLSREAYLFLINCATQIIDEYNDKFDDIAKGNITGKEFIAKYLTK